MLAHFHPSDRCRASPVDRRGHVEPAWVVHAAEPRKVFAATASAGR